MQTLIKWPGGKSKEFDYIKDMIPPFKRYVEPFFGGGAVLFQLRPKKVIINDICEELISFYRFLADNGQREEFKTTLYEYADNWEKIPKYLDLFKNDLFALYGRHKASDVSDGELKKMITTIISREEQHFNGLFRRSFCLDEKNLFNQIISNLVSKIKRTKKIEIERGTLPEGDLYKNLETAFRSGFYMHFRDVMNFCGSKYKISSTKKIANYYFIREFCYGAMFRFNSDGHFNIPYGGIAYNSKDFRGKVDYVFSDEVKELFMNAVIKNEDFETIFNNYKLSSDDFIFLDPPYDTDFCDYEKNTFDRKDQERLAKCLYATKSKFLLIIKDTPFIKNLYSNRKNLKIDTFEKTYLYNVKGRNDRDVDHLIVYNY